MADRLGSFRRECGFYAALSTPAAASAPAPTPAASPLPAPAVWFARHTPATGAACLLFEDLGGAEWAPGDQVAGATPELARAVVHDAAALHAAFWNDARLAGWTASGWLPALDGAHIASFDAAEFGASWPRWRRRFAADADALPPGLAAALDADAGAFPAAAARLLGRCAASSDVRCVCARLTCVCTRRLGAAPRTLLHGDLRLDNVLWAAPGAAGAPPQTRYIDMGGTLLVAHACC
jgi:hypothetical protein